MTSARIVTPGQAMAMMPTMTARTPSRIIEADADLNMGGAPSSGLAGCQVWSSRRSAGDLDLVVDVDDAARHPGRADHCVVLGPGADVAGQRDDAAVGGHLHVAVAGNQCGTVQRLVDVQVDVDRIVVVADLDLIPDVADPGQPGDRHCGRGALSAVA